MPPPKNGRVHNLSSLNSPKFWTLPFFGGGPFWTLSFQRVASSGLCFFSILAQRKLRGGKNSGTSCISIPDPPWPPVLTLRVGFIQIKSQRHKSLTIEFACFQTFIAHHVRVECHTECSSDGRENETVSRHLHYVGQGERIEVICTHHILHNPIRHT